MGDVSGRGPGPDAQIDLDALADLLADLDGGQASTRPVSIALPAPLADALRLLTESGVLTSTSAAASAELERLVRNLALRLQLDELYRDRPDLRPDEETVAAVRARNRVVIDQGHPGNGVGEREGVGDGARSRGLPGGAVGESHGLGLRADRTDRADDSGAAARPSAIERV
jgi:plasmid stabilization system protein ParE